MRSLGMAWQQVAADGGGKRHRGMAPGGKLRKSVSISSGAAASAAKRNHQLAYENGESGLNESVSGEN
jgi:hypothetical protein